MFVYKPESEEEQRLLSEAAEENKVLEKNIILLPPVGDKPQKTILGHQNDAMTPLPPVEQKETKKHIQISPSSEEYRVPNVFQQDLFFAKSQPAKSIQTKDEIEDMTPLPPVSSQLNLGERKKLKLLPKTPIDQNKKRISLELELLANMESVTKKYYDLISKLIAEYSKFYHDMIGEFELQNKLTNSINTFNQNKVNNYIKKLKISIIDLNKTTEKLNEKFQLKSDLIDDEIELLKKEYLIKNSDMTKDDTKTSITDIMKDFEEMNEIVSKKEIIVGNLKKLLGV
jgi:hypothetical protein